MISVAIDIGARCSSLRFGGQIYWIQFARKVWPWVIDSRKASTHSKCSVVRQYPASCGASTTTQQAVDELFERSILAIDESRTSTLCSWRSTYRGALAGERKLLMQRSQNLVSLWLPRHSCFNVASFLFFADVPIHRLDPPWLPLYGSRAET